MHALRCMILGMLALQPAFASFAGGQDVPTDVGLGVGFYSTWSSTTTNADCTAQYTVLFTDGAGDDSFVFQTYLPHKVNQTCLGNQLAVDATPDGPGFWTIDHTTPDGCRYQGYIIASWDPQLADYAATVASGGCVHAVYVEFTFQLPEGAPEPAGPALPGGPLPPRGDLRGAQEALDRFLP